MYPKNVTIENDKIKDLLKVKSDLVITGRTISEEIEKLEAEMQEIDNQMKELEKGVDISYFQIRERQITKQVEKAIEEMEGIQKKIKDKMIDSVPKELGDKYGEIKDKKEKLENDRNKIALKVQKYNDKIIPLGRKLMKPYLEDTFDDYETITLENGSVIATIFNHLEEFKVTFNKNKK